MKLYDATTLNVIARNVIKKYDTSLLYGEPCAIPIEQIIELFYKLNIEYRHLRKNGDVLGCTVFDDTLLPTDEKAKLGEDELYAIIVHGIVPEYMPFVAFRRKKHYQSADKKVIKCPFCNGILSVVDKHAKLELVRYPKKAKASIPTKTSMQCGKCRNMIGLLYAAA